MTENRTPLTAKELASIFREIRLGATVIEACGGCKNTVRRLEGIRNRYPEIAEIYRESCAARKKAREVKVLVDYYRRVMA